MNELYRLLNDGIKALDDLKENLQLKGVHEVDAKPVAIKIQYRSTNGIVSVGTLGDWIDDD